MPSRPREHLLAVRDGESLPLVAVICDAPILCDGVSAALDGIAEVRGFPAEQGDTAGLLRLLRPDAVVVDGEREAAEATAFARETNSTLVHVSLRKGRVRVLRDGAWDVFDGAASSAQTIRNVLITGILRGARRR